MRFELTPEGVMPLRFGMSGERARLALERWGEPAPFRRSSESDSGWVVQRTSTSVFVYCDAGGQVEAVEFASPGHGVAADDQVGYDGIDVFLHPADEVIRMLAATGLDLTDEESGYSTTAPSVLLSLWRDGEPHDSKTGLPEYFESVLIARPGYYD